MFNELQWLYLKLFLIILHFKILISESKIFLLYFDQGDQRHTMLGTPDCKAYHQWMFKFQIYVIYKANQTKRDIK